MKLFRACLLSVMFLAAVLAMGQANPPGSEYHIYAGNTHSHTEYTWSHGEMYLKGDCGGGIVVYGPDARTPSVDSWTDGYKKPINGCASIIIIGDAQYPGPHDVLRPDWQKYQGPPAEHYALAKAHGYDFYVTSDHSQEADLQPPGAKNPNWEAAKREAAEATDSNFVALAGVEHSENNGPGGTGHLNVINSDGYLNALAPGVDLPYLYRWLKTARPNGQGPVVVSFNHPGPHQYHDWDYRDPQITDIITMLEVINSNNKIHYEAFINALDKGWKVSPVCGNDNHGLTGITTATSRTFVLATGKTKVAILEAMKHRRTYASLDTNIQCRYTVNGAIMGSTLQRPNVLKFDIAISDPDTGNPRDQITKIDIVKDGGEVVQTYRPTPAYSIRWSPVINDSTSKYCFVRVWNAGGGDAPGADPAKPVAWLAPVWTGR